MSKNKTPKPDPKYRINLTFEQAIQKIEQASTKSKKKKK